MHTSTRAIGACISSANLWGWSTLMWCLMFHQWLLFQRMWAMQKAEWKVGKAQEVDREQKLGSRSAHSSKLSGTPHRFARYASFCRSGWTSRGPFCGLFSLRICSMAAAWKDEQTILTLESDLTSTTTEAESTIIQDDLLLQLLHSHRCTSR